MEQNKGHKTQVTAPNVPTANPYCQLFVEGTIFGYFNEFLNLGKEFDVLVHKIIGVGGQDINEKIPGRLRYKRVTLKREITSSLEVWGWRRDVETGNVSSARKNCQLTVYDESATEIAAWTLENAWPMSVVSERRSDGTNYEVITLATESLTRIS